MTQRRELRERAKGALLRAPIPFRRRLLLGGWRSYEWLRARKGGHGNEGSIEADAGHWPLPPQSLRVLVTGDADADYFLRGGREQVEFFSELLRRNGVEPGELGDVLDFGCGCGRLARWWPLSDAQRLHGCDYNPKLVAWCRQNLPFMQTRTSELEPPLPYDDDSFDFVYALSVFTHLGEDLQRPWIDELSRVLKPGGALLFTSSGSAYGNHLSSEEGERFAAGELIIRFPEVAGTNLCAAYHPRRYVEENLLRGFELLEVIEPGADPSSSTPLLVQDTYLSRRRP